MSKKEQSSIDHQVRYLKKGKRFHFGYKKPVLTDDNDIQLSPHRQRQ